MIKEQFISEPIQPVTDAFDSAFTDVGGPCFPLAFSWGNRIIRIAQVRRTWRATGPCRHGSNERYVRKHWYEVVTETGEIMKIYFNRQPKGGKKEPRWWLFSTLKE